MVKRKRKAKISGGTSGLPESRERFFSQTPKKEIKLKPFQKYQIVRLLKKDIKLLCSIACVSRSGCYQWLPYQNQPPKDHDDYLVVKEIFDRGKDKWGWRQVQMKLKSLKNITINYKKIKRIKNKYGLVTKIRQKNPTKPS